MTLKAVTKLVILLVVLAALALPLAGTPVSAAQGNTQGQPTINGILHVGETLTADTSTFSDPDGIFGVTYYQWFRWTGSPPEIALAGGIQTTTYTLVEADLGADITVRVTYYDSNFAQENTHSSRVGPVLPALDDRPALMALYDSTDGANWDDNTNWNTTATLDTWYGVVTDTDGRVDSLILRDNNLDGSIPAELGNLSKMWKLALSDNNLQGSIPTELGNLSSSLAVLELSNQGYETVDFVDGKLVIVRKGGLTGTIPTSFADLDKLQVLSLEDNQLTGTIPSGLDSLTAMEVLHLQNNQLSGPIPSGLGSLTELEELKLSGNEFTGGIPSGLGNLILLEVLALDNNQLGGPIPSALGDLTAMTDMSLNNNMLTGTIPSQLGNLIQLETLPLHDNRLSGPIPSELGNLTGLGAFLLQNNQLSGPIPPELGNLTAVGLLQLENNGLSGSIPPELDNLTGLWYLSLQNNGLSGSIPSELGSLTAMQVLYLNGNQLSGPIPSELGSLTGLFQFYLNGNQLSGPIPSELGSLTQLQNLYLSDNQLSGPIPPELGGITTLQRLHLSDNDLSGTIPPELGSLPILRELSLSTNRLSGPMPEELGELQGLKYARFAGNGLTACVPEGLNYLLTAPDYDDDPAHDFIGVDANGDGDYDDEGDTPGLGLLFCGDGELSALKLSGVTLNPAFTSRRETYTGTAPYEVVSTTVTAELNRPQDAFTIEKDGDIYTGNDAVPLIAGSASPNVVTIEVAVPYSTATKTYTVVVTRKDRERERVTVPSNWSLIPDGFGPGEQFRLLFVTSRGPRRHFLQHRRLRCLRAGTGRSGSCEHPEPQLEVQGRRQHRRFWRPRPHRHHRRRCGHLLSERREDRRQLQRFLRRLLGQC